MMKIPSEMTLLAAKAILLTVGLSAIAACTTHTDKNIPAQSPSPLGAAAQTVDVAPGPVPRTAQELVQQVRSPISKVQLPAIVIENRSAQLAEACMRSHGYNYSAPRRSFPLAESIIEPLVRREASNSREARSHQGFTSAQSACTQQALTDASKVIEDAIPREALNSYSQALGSATEESLGSTRVQSALGDWAKCVSRVTDSDVTNYGDLEQILQARVAELTRKGEPTEAQINQLEKFESGLLEQSRTCAEPVFAPDSLDGAEQVNQMLLGHARVVDAILSLAR